MRAWQYWMRGAWLVVLAGACAATPPPRDVSWEVDTLPERHVESPASGTLSSGHDRASLGFVLEATLRARRMHHGRPVMVLELSSGATVIDGDRLQASIRTSQDAYLYVAFCSQHAKGRRYAGLKVFPDEGALHVRAYETTIVPDRAAEIVLDDKPSQEVLYLIVSRADLSSSDSELAQVLDSARTGSQAADCGSPFRVAVSGARSESKTNRAWSGNSPLRGKRPASPGAAPGRTRQPALPHEEDPVVEIQRGGDIVWNNGALGVEADPAGIVILRYGLTHVAAP